MSSIITQGSDRTLHYHHDDTLPSPQGDEVLVKFLASPINPLDILVLAGRYPVQPKHSHNGEVIPGYDGVGEVIASGAQVSNLAPGDLVVPSQFGVGTWRSHAVLPPSMVQKVARPKEVAFASLLRMSVSTAYFLVEEMRDLRPKECIILNAGTSAVAHYVTQFAVRKGIDVILVIRDREAAATDEVKKTLRTLGASEVYSESELAAEAAGLRKSRGIVLALDSVHGASGSQLLATLSDGGTYVHLGFLGGGQGELKVGPQDLFGRRLTLRGYRGSAHMAARSPEEQRRHFDWWVDLFNQGQLKLPVLGLSFVEWEAGSDGQAAIDAVKHAQVGQLGQRKQVLIFR